MIINNTKEGAIVVPCMKGLQVVKKHALLPGHNEIPNDLWDMMKEPLQRHLKTGVVKIYVKEVKKAIPVKKEETNLLTEESFPYREVTRAIKALGKHEAISVICKDETGKKNMSKDWLIGYLQETPEEWEEIKASLSELSGDDFEDNKEFTEELPLTLKELPPEDAEKVILDTFSVETLERWKNETADESLRLLILKQIETVNNPPTKGASN
jgi:hypothetical protein